MPDTVGAQASAITISMEGRGNDVFLYWAADCLDHSGEGGEYHFIEGNFFATGKGGQISKLEKIDEKCPGNNCLLFHL